MTSVAVGDLRPYPLTTVDVRGLEIDRRQGPELEMDGARQPQDLRRVRLDRLDLQGAAHRRARSRSGAIHGTTTKAIAIGHAVREAQRAP